MQALSATSAISPAIDRTKRFLFQNIRFGTFLKLCLVAVLTEGGGANFQVPGQHHRHPPGPGVASLAPVFPPTGFHLTPGVFVLILAAATILVAIVLVVCYLITRLRFAWFHCLVGGTREIRPGWRIYDEQSWRFFLLDLGVRAAFAVLVVILALPFVLGFIRFFEAGRATRHFDVAGFLALFLPLIPVILLIVLLALAIHIVLRDFMLPHYALENASAASAWQAVRQRMAAEKGAFFLYALLRIVLPLAAGVAALIVLLIPAVILAAIVIAVIHGVNGMVAGAGGASLFILVFLRIIAVVAAAAAALFAVLAVGGPIGTWVRTYALLFYGGRYRPLGDLLAPPLAPPAPELPPLPI